MSENVVTVPKDSVAFYVPDLTSPWCIRPGYGRLLYRQLNKFAALGYNLSAIYPDLKMEARRPRDIAQLHTDFVTWFDGDTPVVDVNGTLMEDEPPSRMAGETKTITYPQIAKVLNNLVYNSPCDRIILKIRSYGGNASGAIQCMDSIARLAKEKPIIGYINNYACSGGYFLASQCTELIASKGAEIGNIGIFMVLVDDSKALESMGLKLIKVSSSELKGAGADGKITKVLVEDTQRIINEYHEELTSRVQTARSLSDKELTAVADGRIHKPVQSIKLKLIDKVINWDEYVDIATEADSYQSTSNTGKKRSPDKGEPQMSKPTLEQALAQIDTLKGEVKQLTTDKQQLETEQANRLSSLETSIQDSQEQLTQFQTQIDDLTTERDQAVADKQQAEKQAADLKKAEDDREIAYRKKYVAEWIKTQVAEAKLLPKSARKMNAFLQALTPHTGAVTIKYTDADETEQVLQGELYDVAIKAVEGCFTPAEMSHLTEESRSMMSAEDQAKLDAGKTRIEERAKTKGLEFDNEQPLANAVDLPPGEPNNTGIGDMDNLFMEANYE